MTTQDAVNPLRNVSFRIPFDQIKPEHAEPAIDELLSEARAALKRLGQAPERQFAGFLDDLDHLGTQLHTVAVIVGHLEGVVSSDAWRDAWNAVLPKLSAFQTEVSLDPDVWAALKAYARTPEAQTLSSERARFLKLNLDEYRRGGADLPDDGKARLTQINERLAEITSKFSQNVMDGIAAFDLYVPEERLAGVPQRVKDATREGAEAHGQSGHRLTLHAPVYSPVMTYADDRDLREALHRAYNQVGTGAGRDNRELLPEILKLRREKAELLGYANFADLVLEDRMAGSGRTAVQFERDLEARTRPAFERENDDLRAFHRQHAGEGAPELAPWDVGYWAEKQRQAEYDFDDEELRPYFSLDGVLSGLFEITKRVFGVSVCESEAPGWHPEVRYYDILNESGDHIASFYTDWFPRDSKRGGAWMNAFVTGGPREGDFAPHLGLMCGNMTPPSTGSSAGVPALLSHDEVQTVFHEFGHLLHHALTSVPLRSLAGTNVAWDFVELPSQIMENWCWEKGALDLFARHYQTGETIPQVLFDKMLAARNFRAANTAMRQYSFGTVDLALHSEYFGEGDVVQYARDILGRFSAVAPLPDSAFIAQFGHLFSSPVGYAAGYYSYKWAEVLDADAFSRFASEGIFNRQTGRDFVDHVLSRGNSADPAQLYREFMGRDPDPEALLRRSGLLAGH